jgi:hypothetical protein
MVGLIKACVRVVSRGGGKKQKPSSSTKEEPSPPAYVKVACLLGLRVSPSHRYGRTAVPLELFFFQFSPHADA